MNLTRRGLFKLVAGAFAGVAALVGSKALGKGSSLGLIGPPTAQQWFRYDYQVTWSMSGIATFNIEEVAERECLFRIKRDLQHFGFREVPKTRYFAETTTPSQDYRRFTMRILGQKI